MGQTVQRDSRFWYFAGDTQLLPAAVAILEQIHKEGVIHGDLRPENFMVRADVPADKPIFILDFSHSQIDRSQEAQLSEMCNLQILFQSL